MKSNSVLNALGDNYIATCEGALRTLMNDVPSITAAVVATADGFEVASAQADGHMSATRLSALASSLLALGQAALRELSMVGSGSVLIENSMGKIMLVDVRRAHLPVVLCVVADEMAMTGKVLWAAKQCAVTLESNSF
jgi:predicted regulator of Ras-like GTPase activity (Roadblock/LC7/MglB family)